MWEIFMNNNLKKNPVYKGKFLHQIPLSVSTQLVKFTLQCAHCTRDLKLGMKEGVFKYNFPNQG